MLATTIALLAVSSQVNALVQSFCSTQNTGSSFTPVSSQWQSNGACQTTCQGAGYYLAIVQYTLCWCTNYAPSTTVPVANCSNPCPGFPYESCGSQANNLFGYIELSGYTPVSSTVNTPSAPAASSTKATSVVQAPTVIVTSINTVVSTRVNTIVISQSPANPVTLVDTTTAVILITPSALFTPSQSSSTTAQVASPSTTIAQLASPSTTIAQLASPLTTIVQVASSSTTTDIPISSQPPTPVTSTLIITASGAVITQYITTTPSRAASTSQAASIKQANKFALSNGAVAGITIGAVIGAALLGALIFFFCRRRRHDADYEEGSGITRNTSVLSRVGLLRGARAGAPGSQRAVLPSIAMAESPSSPQTRFVDTRLNPNALMVHQNASRTSVGTLQDDKDYSRPLEVRNPDTR